MKAISTIEKTLTNVLLAAQAENKPITRNEASYCAFGHLPRSNGDGNTETANRIFGISIGQAWCFMSGWDGNRLSDVRSGAREAIKTKTGRALYNLGARLAKKFVK